MKSFENWLKRIPGFREQLKSRQQNKENMRASAIGEYVKLAIESAETKNRPGGVSQLAKPRLPPLWSGQKYDRWKIEVAKWSDDNKLSYEEKYVDLLESLKKNYEIKQFVVNTLIEKVGRIRTVKKTLEVMTEKFSKNN